MGAQAAPQPEEGLDAASTEEGACRWPHKTEYPSRALAENAAVLHTMASLDSKCTDVNAYPCGDHWHVGHTSRRAAKRCKTELQPTRPKYAWRAERREAVESGEVEKEKNRVAEQRQRKTEELRARKKLGPGKRDPAPRGVSGAQRRQAARDAAAAAELAAEKRQRRGDS